MSYRNNPKTKEKEDSESSDIKHESSDESETPAKHLKLDVQSTESVTSVNPITDSLKSIQLSDEAETPAKHLKWDVQSTEGVTSENPITDSLKSIQLSDEERSLANARAASISRRIASKSTITKPVNVRELKKYIDSQSIYVKTSKEEISKGSLNDSWSLPNPGVEKSLTWSNVQPVDLGKVESLPLHGQSSSGTIRKYIDENEGQSFYPTSSKSIYDQPMDFSSYKRDVGSVSWDGQTSFSAKGNPLVKSPVNLIKPVAVKPFVSKNDEPLVIKIPPTNVVDLPWLQRLLKPVAVKPIVSINDDTIEVTYPQDVDNYPWLKSPVNLITTIDDEPFIPINEEAVNLTTHKKDVDNSPWANSSAKLIKPIPVKPIVPINTNLGDWSTDPQQDFDEAQYVFNEWFSSAPPQQSQSPNISPIVNPVGPETSKPKGPKKPKYKKKSFKEKRRDKFYNRLDIKIEKVLTLKAYASRFHTDKSRFGETMVNLLKQERFIDGVNFPILEQIIKYQVEQLTPLFEAFYYEDLKEMVRDLREEDAKPEDRKRENQLVYFDDEIKTLQKFQEKYIEYKEFYPCFISNIKLYHDIIDNAAAMEGEKKMLRAQLERRFYLRNKPKSFFD